MMKYRHTMRTSHVILFVYLYGSTFLFLCLPAIYSTNAGIEDRSKATQSLSSPVSQPSQTSPCTNTDVRDCSNVEQTTRLLKIPQPSQSFFDIKTQKEKMYAIVDKSDFIRKLIDNDDIDTLHKVYFLARPKTFGKTFFLSMVHTFLDGISSAFNRTRIASRGNAIKEGGKWSQHPVISIDFSGISAKSVEGFQMSLEEHLDTVAKKYRIRTKNKVDIIGWLIRALKTKFKFPVSILIDEFDSPVTVAPNTEVREGIKKVLVLFYLEIKYAAFNSELWLVLILGVSRLQIFSGAMNGIVHDITFDKKFSSILGFSKDETEEIFKQHLNAFAVENNWSNSADAFAKIEDRYGGYRFSAKGADAVLDAGSVCSCLREFELVDFETKTEALGNIVERMIKEQKGIGYFKRYCIQLTDLRAKYNTQRENSVPLYQEMLCNGYLTIFKRRKGEQDLCLTYPNGGIERLIELALPIKLRSRKQDAGQILDKRYRYSVKALLQDCLNEGDMVTFVKELISLAFPIVSSSLRFKVPSAEKEFLATGYIFRVLKAVGLDCKEGQELVGNDGNLDGDLDLVIYADEKNMPHYAISNKNVKIGAYQAIFQLFRYVVTKNDEFERLFDNQLETDVINLLALVIKDDAIRQKTIKEWILVPYTRQEKKIWITKTVGSSPNIELNLSKYLEQQAYYRGNEKKFV